MTFVKVFLQVGGTSWSAAPDAPGMKTCGESSAALLVAAERPP
jgi:hypothetical protein